MEAARDDRLHPGNKHAVSTRQEGWRDTDHSETWKKEYLRSCRELNTDFPVIQP